MTEDGSLDVLRILSNASAVIAQGEVLQLSTRNNLDTTMDNYLDVVKGKTAALFAAACEVGPVIAGEEKADKNAAQALCEYGMNLGIAFQISDDVLDYNSAREKLGKSVGDDFREGKMTAPVILACQKGSAEEKAFWRRTFADKVQSEEDLKTAQEILAKHNALEDGLEIARAYAAKARLALAEAPDSELRALLDDLVDFTVEREY